MRTVDVVIPNFNGRKMLEKHLPSVLRFTKPLNSLIVVDDCSIDDSSSFLREKYPSVKLLKNPTNLGFTKSVNIGVQSSDADFVVLLNTDVVPKLNYLENALEYLSSDGIFAVTFNEQNSSWPDVSWSAGKFAFCIGGDKTKARYSAWFSGGSSIVNRRAWVKLDGFDPVFSPGYWEDIDLGWRAWKSGYKIIWDPKSKVEHQHESTFSTLKPSYINTIRQRNELLFTWKHFIDRNYSIDHIRFLAKYTFTHPGYARIITAAIAKMRQLRHNDHSSILSNIQILNIVNKCINND